MAVTIFSKRAGLLAAFTDPTIPATTTLRVEEWDGFGSFKSIITKVTVSAQGNFQFLHTLGGNIYIYVFGDRIGQATISGLAFDSTCDDENGTIGIERVIQYYQENRVASRAAPIKITIGTSTTVQGYLVGFNAEIGDPGSRVYNFSMQLMLVPQERNTCVPASDSGSGAAAGNDNGVGGVGATNDSGGEDRFDHGDNNDLIFSNNGDSSGGTTPLARSSGFNYPGTGPRARYN